MLSIFLAQQGADTKILNAVGSIIRAALTIEIAAQLSEPLKSQTIDRASHTINYVIDEYCGVGPFAKVPPKPLPGPLGPALDLATVLAAFANTSNYSENLRSRLMTIAGDLTRRAYAAGGLM